MAKAGALGRMAGFLYNGVGPGRRTGRRAVIVHTFHGHVLEGYFPARAQRVFLWIERWLAARTDVLIAVSPAVRDDLLRKGIGRASRWRVIPLGLSLAAFADLPLPDGGGTLRVGQVGRLVPVKNSSLFVQALARVAREASPAVRALIVGDGPLRAALEEEARALGVDRTVTFTGWRRDLRAVYERLDVACVTSWNEGTPVSLIEAMAAGRAAVATDVGGVRDLLADGAAGGEAIAPGAFHIAARGILIRPGDAEGLAAALRRLGSDGPLRRSLGEAGRRFVTERFTEERLVRDIESLYGELLSQGRRAP
jgi:glycosyltransferase involved in cell wall biosynthesis